LEEQEKDSASRWPVKAVSAQKRIELALTHSLVEELLVYRLVDHTVRAIYLDSEEDNPVEDHVEAYPSWLQPPYQPLRLLPWVHHALDHYILLGYHRIRLFHNPAVIHLVVRRSRLVVCQILLEVDIRLSP
jgi:hypothetical protein